MPETLVFELIPVTEIPPRVRAAYSEAITFKLIPVEQFKMTAVIETPKFLDIGKRWGSIESHMIEYGLYNWEETADWLKGHNKTFYDWLNESLATKV